MALAWEVPEEPFDSSKRLTGPADLGRSESLCGRPAKTEIAGNSLEAEGKEYDYSQA